MIPGPLLCALADILTLLPQSIHPRRLRMCVRTWSPTASLRATDVWMVAGLGIVCCPRRDVCESVGARGRGDPHGVGVILGDLRGVNVRIGIRCG